MTREQELLVIAMEECAEISQAFSKAIRFGVKNINPYTSYTTNAEDIMQEFLQLSAVIGKLQKDGMLPVYDKDTEDEIKAEKLEKIAKYSHKTDDQDSPADSLITAEELLQWLSEHYGDGTYGTVFGADYCFTELMAVYEDNVGEIVQKIEQYETARKAPKSAIQTGNLLNRKSKL